MEPKRGHVIKKGIGQMRYKQGKFIVTGNPTIAWVNKMTKYGLRFTYKDGVVYAELERKQDGEGKEF